MNQKCHFSYPTTMATMPIALHSTENSITRRSPHLPTHCADRQNVNGHEATLTGRVWPCAAYNGKQEALAQDGGDGANHQEHREIARREVFLQIWITISSAKGTRKRHGHGGQV